MPTWKYEPNTNYSNVGMWDLATSHDCDSMVECTWPLLYILDHNTVKQVTHTPLCTLENTRDFNVLVWGPYTGWVLSMYVFHWYSHLVSHFLNRSYSLTMGVLLYQISAFNFGIDTCRWSFSKKKASNINHRKWLCKSLIMWFFFPYTKKKTSAMAGLKKKDYKTSFAWSNIGRFIEWLFDK